MNKQHNESTLFTAALELSEMAKLKAIIFDTPEAEHAKLQLIKEEISVGRYQINSKHIAEKLVEYAPEVESLDMA